MEVRVVLPGLRIGFQLNNRRRYPWIFLLLSLTLLVVAYFAGGTDFDVKWVISVLGVTVGFTTFLFTQQLQETRLFTELFKEFNGRYNHMSAQLSKIAETSETGIHGDDRQVLMNYFNLCAEEYLYYSNGYIDAAAWRAWSIGMKFYADISDIRRIWEQEIAGGSYYGFTLRELDRNA
jgi:hypothetical protein